MTVLGNSLLRVSWKPSANNESWDYPILDYTCSVISSLGVSTKITVSASDHAVTLDISNHPYGNYLINVSARNSLGHGKAAIVWYFSTTSMITTMITMAPSDKVNLALIVGVICGAVVGVFVFFIITFFVLHYRKSRIPSYLTATTERYVIVYKQT